MYMKRFYRWDAHKDYWETFGEPCTKCSSGLIVNAEVRGVAECPDCKGTGQVERRVPPLDYIKVLHTGVRAEQNFSTKFVEMGLKEGWLVLNLMTIELLFQPEKLVYEILQSPGRYCCWDGHKLQDDETGSMARIHVLQEHKGEVSPMAKHPAGYYKNNAYICRLDSATHLRFKSYPNMNMGARTRG